MVCRTAPKVDGVDSRLAPSGEPAQPTQSAQEALESPSSNGMATQTPKDAQDAIGACPSVLGARSEDVASDEGDEYEAGGWRIESKGGGRFAFRQGGGMQRRTMRGVYLTAEELSEEQYERHKQNAEKQAGAKQRASRQRGD